MDPTNFVVRVLPLRVSPPTDSSLSLYSPIVLQNASWSINSLQVYSKLLLNGNVSVSASARDTDPTHAWGIEVLLLVGAGMVTVLGALW